MFTFAKDFQTSCLYRHLEVSSRLVEALLDAFLEVVDLLDAYHLEVVLILGLLDAFLLAEGHRVAY